VFVRGLEKRSLCSHGARQHAVGYVVLVIRTKSSR